MDEEIQKDRTKEIKVMESTNDETLLRPWSFIIIRMHNCHANSACTNYPGSPAPVTSGLLSNGTCCIVKPIFSPFTCNRRTYGLKCFRYGSCITRSIIMKLMKNKT